MVNCHVDPSYFLEEMTMHEVDACLAEHFINYRNTWEQVRLNCYFVASSVSTKKLKITEIIPFSWDKEQVKEIPTKLNAEEVQNILTLGQHFIEQKSKL